MVDARVVTNIDGQTYGRTDERGKPDSYIAPCQRQARQKPSQHAQNQIKVTVFT